MVIAKKTRGGGGEGEGQGEGEVVGVEEVVGEEDGKDGGGSF